MSKYISFPPHIKNILEEKGYFNYTTEDRLKSSQQLLDTLNNISKPLCQKSIIDYYRCKHCGCFFKIAFPNKDMEVLVCPVCEEDVIDYATEEEIDYLDNV